MDFSSLKKHFDMSKLKFDIENNIFNGLIASVAGEMDAEQYTQLVNTISVFNKHGVSTKTLFDVMMELNEGGKDE